MALDTRYVPISILPQFLFDKISAVLLSGGTVEFYHDNSQNDPKDVYQLQTSGNPASYSYVNVGSLLTLNSVGTFVDSNGSEFVPYLFPYDGDADTTTNTLDLYYIIVKNSAGVQQFVVHGVPNLSQSNPDNSNPNVVNHIPNGQFQLHNTAESIIAANTGSPVAITTFAYGSPRGTVAYYPVAPGGIFFERTSGSAATDSISFVQKTQYDSLASASPRYYARIIRSVAGGGSEVCGMVFRFMDVFKFTNPDTTSTAPTLSFVFNAVLGSGSSAIVNINQILYYGSGGSSTTQTILEAGLTVTSAEKQFSTTFTNIPDTSAIVGSLNDDFVEIEIAFQPGTTFDIEITDVMLLNGTYTASSSSSTSIMFPQLTNGQFLLEAASNIAPATQSPFTTSYYPQDGSNLYLPMIMTPDGWSYDYSMIGNIEGTPFTSNYVNSNHFNLFLCDGSTYVSSAYQSNGVPNSRLGKMLISNSPISNTPLYGTGLNFATAYAYAGSPTVLRLSVNNAGVAAAAADGSSPTGFAFLSAHTGSALGSYKAYSNVASTVLMVSNFDAASVHGAVNNGTSGFTLTTGNDVNGLLAQQSYFFTIQTVISTALAGTWFGFSDTTTDYYVWLTVNNVGADPAPGGRTLYTKINFPTGATAQDVANTIRESLNNYQITQITPTGAPAAGSFWQFTTNPGATLVYNVWYSRNGIGTEPATPSGANIKVDVSSTDTAAVVVTKTLTAINAYQYAVPNFQGMFLRGLDPSGTWDKGVLQRWSTISALSGANLGTFEFQQFYSHDHLSTSGQFVLSGSTTANSTGTTAPITLSSATALTGGDEVRPVNAVVNWYIRY